MQTGNENTPINSQKSWESYYKKFAGCLLQHHRLNIYLHDNPKTVEQLHRLGYTEALYASDHEEFEEFLAPGEYCFTATFDDDDCEIEVPAIEIQHPPAKDYVYWHRSLNFIDHCMEEHVRLYAAKNFGFSLELVHSICMFEGYNFQEEARKCKVNGITTPITIQRMNFLM